MSRVAGEACGPFIDQEREIERLEEALRRIERITWREGHGEQTKLLLIDCRKIAYEALTKMKE